MKIFSYILVLIVSLVFSPQSFASNDDLQNTISQLTAKKLRTKLQVVENIIHNKSPKVEFVLESLLEGKVYYIKSNKKVVYVVKENREYLAKDLLNGNSLGKFSKRQLKKVGINNKIRQKIKIGLSMLSLTHSDESVRLKAVKSTYKDINTEVFNRIKVLIQDEKSEKVRDSMLVLMNVYHLDDKDPLNRIRAINSLSRNLEPIVKNKLIQLKNNDPSPEVRVVAEKELKDINSKISFFKNLETVFFGISFGSVLILAAIGLAITFGVMGVINMAHGELIMLGAYTTYVVQLLMPNHIELSIFAAIPAAFVVSGLVGILIQIGIIRHLHGRPLETLLATFGVSLVLQQVVRTIFSPLNRSVETPEWMSGALEINGILSLTWNRLYIIIFCLIVFAALVTVLKKTSLGLQVRAVSQDRNMARAMGVRSNWVDAMTFGLGSGIAGIAGVALSQLTNVGPNLGQAYIIDSFMVVVFGGVGNLWGTLISGFGLGIINKFMEPWVGAVLAKVVILIFIILFIQKRPRGLFPQKGRSAGD
ncbi:MAG TPA: urea ABC transporter permease subunit UrtB [Piscirickettsiaceae bacterium]|jgi:urea transport system permease protein|nr:urea ABC transporter permease subunit UrtB [Piscirickettsiaceae bacterium]